jgi:hypothetical protein
MIAGMRALLRLAMIFVAIAGFAAGQEPAPAQDPPAAPAPQQDSNAGKRRSSTVRRTAGARNGKPRKIKMQKMRGVPKFKKPKRF